MVLDGVVCSSYPLGAHTPTIGLTVVFKMRRILIMKEKGTERRKIYRKRKRVK
jgi:hypothetical protein